MEMKLMDNKYSRAIEYIVNISNYVAIKAEDKQYKTILMKFIPSFTLYFSCM